MGCDAEATLRQAKASKTLSQRAAREVLQLSRFEVSQSCAIAPEAAAERLAGRRDAERFRSATTFLLPLRTGVSRPPSNVAGVGGAIVAGCIVRT